MHKKILAYRQQVNQNSTNNVQNKSENCEDTHVPETQFVSLIVRDGQWVEPTQSSNGTPDSIQDIPEYIPM